MNKWIKAKSIECNSQRYLKANVISSSNNQDDILLLKLDAIGDFVIWLDSAKEYRNIFPNSKIALLCNTCNKVIAEKVDLFDNVLSINMGRFLVDTIYRQECANLLGNHQYGKLIQTAYSRTIEMDVIAAMIPANEKIAMQSDVSRNNVSRNIVFESTKRLADKVYSRILPVAPGWKMEISRNADFIRALGNADFKGTLTQLPGMTIDAKLPTFSYFVVFPGASSGKRQWYTENFAKLIEHVLNKTSLKCVICGAQNEKCIAQSIISMTKGNRLLDKVGETSIPELIEYIRNAKFVITNDTSGVHFAAATGTPSVCIAGEHNIGRFLPYVSEIPVDENILPRVCTAGMHCAQCTAKRKTVRCLINVLVEKHFQCIRNISYNTVENAVDDVIAQLGEK